MSQVATLKAVVLPARSAVSNLGLVLGGTLFLAAMAQISLPVPGSPVPITGQTLGALLLGTAYGASLGFSTFAFYIIAGVAGAPIFAGQSAGIERLTGATGGYLVGMLLASWITGALAGRKWDQKIATVIPTMLIGTTIIFTFGLIWLHQSTGQSWTWTFEKGLQPFVIGEVIKIAIASTALPTVWRFVSKR